MIFNQKCEIFAYFLQKIEKISKKLQKNLQKLKTLENLISFLI